MDKSLKMSVLKFVIEDLGGKKNLSGESVYKLIQLIRAMPLKVDDKEYSRYSPSATGNECAMVFSDEIKTIQASYEDLDIGVFLKRRGNNRPLEDGEDGSLIQLTLQNESHEVAEVSYFGIHRESGILFLTYNPLVGGVNQLIIYLNSRINSIRRQNIEVPIDGLTEVSTIQLYYIAYPDSERVFREDMDQIQGLEFHIAAEPEFLASQFLFDDVNRDRLGMQLIKEFAKESNCANISIKISAEKPKKIKGKGREKRIRYSTLNKQFLVRFYDSTKMHLQSRKDSRFNIKGRVVDEDLRLLDLVNSRLTYPLKINIQDGYDILNSHLSSIPVLISAKINEAQKYYGYEAE